MKIHLTEQETNAVKYAICLRLASIRGYGLDEEIYLQNVLDKLAKKLNK